MGSDFLFQNTIKFHPHGQSEVSSDKPINGHSMSALPPNNRHLWRVLKRSVCSQEETSETAPVVVGSHSNFLYSD
jgi:hypothetical protein